MKCGIIEGEAYEGYFSYHKIIISHYCSISAFGDTGCKCEGVNPRLDLERREDLRDLVRMCNSLLCNNNGLNLPTPRTLGKRASLCINFIKSFGGA